MNKDNYKVYIYCNIGLFLLVVMVYARVVKPMDLSSWVLVVSKSISIVVVISIVFVKWLWKCKWFHPWLVPFPNLEGKWEGSIKTTFKDEQHNIPLEVTITQTFFQITVRIKTLESQSISNGAYFPIDMDGKVSHLYYSYVNTPNRDVRDRSVIHYGTTRLDFDHYPVNKLSGEYWTSRCTTGTIELKKTNNERSRTKCFI